MKAASSGPRAELLLLSHAGTYGLLILAACCVGLGSAIFHPEASRVDHRLQQ
jgi:hypothetical protein